MKEETPSDMEDIIVISRAFLSSAWIWAGDFSQLTSKKTLHYLSLSCLNPLMLKQFLSAVAADHDLQRPS